MTRDACERNRREAAFAAEAERRGYRGVKLVAGVWCAEADSVPDWTRDPPEGAPAGLRAMPGTDQASIGRMVDRMMDA